MFNLWNTVAGNPSSSTASPISNKEKKDLSAQISNADSSINDDKVAEDLLARFPEYGSSRNRNNDEFYDDDIDDEDDEEESKENNTNTSSNDFFQYDKKNGTLPQSNSGNWDNDEKDLWKVDENNKLHPQHLNFSFTLNSSSSETKTINAKKKVEELQQFSNEIKSGSSSFDRNDQKQHWMPDSLCKQCYACETPFTVFRRRHHCRLCGRVFCSNCSAFFVELAPENIPQPPTTLNTGEKRNQANEKRHQNKLGGKGVLPQNQLHHQKEQKRTMRSCKICYDQVYSSPSHAALYGLGKNEAAGRWEHHEGSNGDEVQHHSLRKITSQSNIAKLKNTNEFGDGVKSERATRLSTIKDPSWSVQSPTSSSRRPLQSKKGATSNTKSSGDRNLIDTQISQDANTIRVSFVNKDLDSYDESSFQALNLTKQKLQERAAAALKAVADAKGEQTPDLNLLLQQHELQQQRELQVQDNDTSNDIKMNKMYLHQRNKIIDGEHDALHIGTENAFDHQSVSFNESIDKRPPLSRIISSLVDRKNKEADVSKQSIVTEQDQINTKIEIKEDNEQNITAKNLEHSFTTSNVDVAFSEVNSTQKNLSNNAHPQSQSQRIGELAAKHLEKMTRELIITDAPLLLQEFPNGKWKKWINTILMLVTRACATVMPNVKMGDLLDIRPYCKVKVIAGGLSSDSAYVSGIVFHKNVSHKQMAKEIINPRIMLLSGGIEFTRTSNQIASLETLLEQEEKYMEIVVMKIIGLKPSVLMVGKSVNRRAQELLLNAKIVLIQKVKSDLMSRIARQTGATILSSMDHVMTQFEISILGRCRRFRLVTFRDEEAWKERCSQFQRIARSRLPSQSYHGSKPLPMSVVLQSLPNCHRQAVLAANRIGQNVMDGSVAVKCGLAKRGVARTYIMLEGCPKQLGCTVILRGASRATLKQIKRVLSFLFTVGYNLKLETSYLKERRVCPPLDYKERDETQASSSSLCVHYGKHPFGRKSRPWNGGNLSKGKIDLTRSISGKVTAFDHQSILITSVWMTGKVQCCPAEVKGICYYSLQDVSLGQFLRDSCFNLNLKCQNSSCKKSVMEHSLSFIHNDGLINITVEQMDEPLPATTNQNSSNRENSRTQNISSKDKETTTSSNESDNAPIATWTYCTHCRKVVTPLVFISDKTWQLSFGKFVEIYFYNKDFVLHSKGHSCSCQMQSKAILYFGCGRLAARFTYERIEPYSVYVRKSLPFNYEFHLQDALVHLEKISNASSYLFSRFDKHIERVSRETRQLFASSVNKADFLQTLLGELNAIGSEVDHAAKTVHEKIAAITISCTESNDFGTKDKRMGESPLLRFPWHARRYLALLTSVWNERLSAVGQAVTAMKKLSAAVQHKASSGRGELAVVGMNAAANAIVGESYGTTSDDVVEAMKKVKKVKESYSQYNVRDLDIRSYSDRINMASRSYESNHDPYDSKHERIPNHRQNRSNRSDYDMHDYEEDVQDDIENDMLEFNSNEFESLILEDGPDFDAMLSRQRQKSNDRVTVPLRPTKSLGTRRPLDMNKSNSRSMQSSGRLSRQSSLSTPSSPPQTFKPYDHPLVSPPQETSKSKTVTPGGAVKSVITRFFNRGYKEMDPYVVDLGIFSEGSPRLEPGIGGMVIPVYENQPSTIIAHSLNSEEYHKQFRKYSNLEKDMKGSDESASNISERTFDDKNNDPLGSTTRVRPNKSAPLSPRDERKDIERRMLVESKAHIKDTFKELDLKGQQMCKYICTTFWATQFHAVRQAFLSSSKTDSQSDEKIDVEQTYIQSLSASNSWAASGGKSGASFSLTKDGRFVVKCISRTELQMFLDCASAYFEYLSKAFFHGLPTVLCKILGVYQIGYTNRVTGKRSMEQVAVMQNIFYDRKISVTFDLKGTQRGRFAKLLDKDKRKSKVDSMNEENVSDRDTDANKSSSKKKYARKGSKNDYDESSSDSSNQSEDSEEDSPMEESSDGLSSNDSKATNEKVHGNGSANKNAGPTLLDGDFLEFTGGRPLPLNDRAKALFHMSILNDTLFLSLINVLDYSILVGIDDEKKELVVGIIDFMRQYDILKQMERVGKSIPMVVGASLPTIIQPPLYKARFTNAMERYFMTVPNKWTTI